MLQILQQVIVNRMKNPATQTPATATTVKSNRECDTVDDPINHHHHHHNHHDYKEFLSLPIDQLLDKLHQVLLQCQCFGDQKMKLTSQIMETLGSKTRQLINWGVDTKAQGK